MVKPKILLYINLFLKTIVLIVLFSIGFIFMVIGFLFSQFFDMFIFIPFGIVSILLLSSFILWYFIFFCERMNEYQNIKYFYLANFFGESFFLWVFFNQFIIYIIEGNPDSAFVYLCFIISILIAFITGIIYFFLKRKIYFHSKVSAEGIEKLKEILSVSDRIKLERVQNILNLDGKVFDEKIIAWAKEFGFRIDGEYLVVNKESISEFINELDDQFAKWEQMEKDKEGKF